jgi:hypothetical protein
MRAARRGARTHPLAIYIAGSTGKGGEVTNRGRQGLTLVHFSAQLEPWLTLTHKTSKTPYTGPDTPLIRAAQPLRAPPIL